MLNWLWDWKKPVVPDPYVEAEKILRECLKTAESRLDEQYTKIGHVEGALGVPLLAILLYTILYVERERLFGDPAEHKNEIFQLTTAGLTYLTVSATVGLELLQEYGEKFLGRKINLNFPQIYNVFGQFEGIVGIPSLYFLIDEIFMGKKDEVFDEPEKHELEIFSLVAKAILLVVVVGIFTTQQSLATYRKINAAYSACYKPAAAPIYKTDKFPEAIKAEIDKALKLIPETYSSESFPPLETYYDLEQWSYNLSKDGHYTLARIIDFYLEQIKFTNRFNEAIPLLSVNNNRSTYN